MECLYPLEAWRSKSGGITFDAKMAFRDMPLKLPCGRCLACRIEYSRTWAVRIMHEAQLYDRSAFMTLTYKPECLPVGGTLVKEHVQDFFRRLRKKSCKNGEKIRYYCSGEYGEKDKRPHYHAIIFGFWPKDSIYFKKAPSGEKLYTSQIVEEVWPFGFSNFGDCTFESAQYVASYCTKKVMGKGADEYYRLEGKIPEFALMSRRPGIGSGWYERFKDETLRDGFIVMSGKEMSVPRYYKNKLEVEEPFAFAKLKAKNNARAKERYLKDPRHWNDKYGLAETREQILKGQRGLFGKNNYEVR